MRQQAPTLTRRRWKLHSSSVPPFEPSRLHFEIRAAPLLLAGPEIPPWERRLEIAPRALATCLPPLWNQWVSLLPWSLPPLVVPALVSACQKGSISVRVRW